MLALCVAAPSSWSQPERLKVLVLTGPDQRPGFVAALRIQLAADSEVVAVTAPPGDSLAERLAAAATGVEERGAALAVWLERGPGDGYVLYAVGRRSNRGVIEVGRVAPGLNADRELALKVGALVDDLAHQPTAATVLEPGPETDEAETVAEAAAADVDADAAAHADPVPVPVPDLRWSALASAAATSAMGFGEPRAQRGVAIGLGARLRRGSRYLELSVAGRWLADRVVTNDEGRATLSELGGALKAGAFAELAGLEVGPELALSWRQLETAARTTDDFMGEATSSIPAIDLVATARLPVLDHLSVAVSVGGGVNLVSEQMTIRDQVAVDVRRARLVTELAVVGSFFE